MGPTRYFLTNEPPGNSSTSAFSTLSVDHEHVTKKKVLSSCGSTDDDESVSSWPFSRPPSLSHFDDDERVNRAEIFQQQMRRQERGEGIDSNNNSFVMPRVDLPSRKPFSATGLRLGKLKILVAGDSGIGKTDLIQAIIETSQDIVFADEPCVWEAPTERQDDEELEDEEREEDERKAREEPKITETTASSKPYPLYWLADHEEKKKGGRMPSNEEINPEDEDANMGADDGVRCTTASATSSSSSRQPSVSLIQSLETATSADGVLDRNISFVDTEGYGKYTDAMKCVNRVVQYLETQFRQTANIVNVRNPQVLSLFTSASSLTEFGHVDVCLYLVLDRLKPVDIRFISEISKFTPVIPVLSKSDLLSEQDIIDRKLNILKQLRDANVTPFLFDTHINEAIEFGESLQRKRASVAKGAGTTNEKVNDDNIPTDDGNDNRNDDDQDNLATGFASTSASNASASGLFVYPFLMPCAVTTLRSEEEMLASVLMAPDYRPALVRSELKDLLRYILSEHGSAWLRFVTARKFLEWINQLCLKRSLVPYIPVDDRQQSGTLVAIQPYASSAQRGNLFNEIEVSPGFLADTIPSLSNPAITNTNKAQESMANWAIRLEQTSRSENALALRTRSVTSSRRLHRRSSTKKPRGARDHFSKSVHNVDPLNIGMLCKRSLYNVMRALSVIVGVKFLMNLYANFHSKQVVSQTIKAIPKRSDSLISAFLGSLGGGWSTIA